MKHGFQVIVEIKNTEGQTIGAHKEGPVYTARSAAETLVAMLQEQGQTAFVKVV